MQVTAINNFKYDNKKHINTTIPTEQTTPIVNNENNTDVLSFQGKGGSKFGDWISKLFSKWYAEPMYNKNWLHNFSEKLTKSKMPGSMTEHMSTLGAFVTSGVYVGRTLSNKELDSDKRRTLAINQVLCFIIPTICAYTVNSLIKGSAKKLEYRYSGLMKQQKALGKIQGKSLTELNKNFSARLKGFGTLASLLTFTLIYRYITPVLITPVANTIGDKVNKKRSKQREENATEQKSLATA